MTPLRQRMTEELPLRTSSEETIRSYIASVERLHLKEDGPRRPVGQRWATFVQNHANAIVAGNFFGPFDNIGSAAAETDEKRAERVTS